MEAQNAQSFHSNVQKVKLLIIKQLCLNPNSMRHSPKFIQFLMLLFFRLLLTRDHWPEKWNIIQVGRAGRNSS